MTSATSAATAAESVTSQAWAEARPPSPRMITTVSSGAGLSITTHATCAPWRTNGVAVALQLPQLGPTEPAPKAMAILSFNRSDMMRTFDGRGRAPPASFSGGEEALLPHVGDV